MDDLDVESIINGLYKTGNNKCIGEYLMIPLSDFTLL